MCSTVRGKFNVVLYLIEKPSNPYPEKLQEAHTSSNVTVFFSFRLRWCAKNSQSFPTLIIFPVGLLPEVTISFITTWSHVWHIKLSYFLKVRETNEKISFFWFNIPVLRWRFIKQPLNKQHQGLVKVFPFCDAVLCSIAWAGDGEWWKHRRRSASDRTDAIIIINIKKNFQDKWGERGWETVCERKQAALVL